MLSAGELNDSGCFSLTLKKNPEKCNVIMQGQMAQSQRQCIPLHSADIDNVG